MCLAVPGKVVRWLDYEPLFARALVEFGGVSREVSMACLPDAQLDDYVLVHAGIAISRINQQEAEELLATLAAIEEVAEEDLPERTQGRPHP